MAAHIKVLNKSFHCSYCDSEFPLIMNETYKIYDIDFSTAESGFHIYVPPQSGTKDESISIKFFHCPKCNNFTIKASGNGEFTKGLDVPLLPKSNALQFPEYVPASIRVDYEEACSIVFLSPKASATLSRRCLQSMIRDFWGIKKNTLFEEISALESKVDKTQWDVLNVLRKLGNIGAHPEADVNLIIDIEPDDATKLLKVIELLIKQWYINRHDEQQLLSDVLSISTSKQVKKKIR